MAINKTDNRKTSQNRTPKLKPEADDGVSVVNVYEGLGKQSLFLFGMGLAITLFALFLIVAFISYLITGSYDYSWLESDGILDDTVKVRNICGTLGAKIAFFFINDCFGLSAFIIPPFLLMLGFRLMDVFQVKLFKRFIFLTLFMLWLSICLAFVGNYLPFMDNSFLKLGGMHGIKVNNSLKQVIGVPGILTMILFTGICFLTYISKRTVEVVRSFFRFTYLRELQEKRKKKNEERQAAEAEMAKVSAETLSQEDKNEESQLDNKVNETNQNIPNDVLEDDIDHPTEFINVNEEIENEDGVGENNTDNVDDDNFTIVTPHDNVLNQDNNEDDTLSLGNTTSQVLSEEENALAIAAALSARNMEGMSNSVTLDITSEEETQDYSKQNSSDTFEEKETSNSLDLDVTLNDTEIGTGHIIREDDSLAPYDPHKDLENYKYPTIDLLAKTDINASPTIDMEEQNANKERIIHVLKNFGVEISKIQATIGPTITLYEIVPAEGTRISKIRNLEDDIALSLAAEGIRIIAPIPGKGTIGIEVPNKKKCIVSMESIINSKTYQESTMELPCAIGKTISNEVFMFDLAKSPHLLVAGATGQGKSVGLNAIITSLLYKKHPSELKIVMVDPKKVEFSIYSPIENHFLARLEEEEDCIITDVQKVVKTLNSLCVLMDSRYDLLKKAGVRNIKEYNAKFKERKLNPENGHEFMPYIVVIVDEFGDLIMTAGKEVELPICRIAQLARAVGIHMIIATQRPQASIISGAIKTNFPTRIAFKVSSMMDSRVILDRSGANQLIGKGDLLYLAGAEPVRVQCAFVDTPEVSDICNYIARQQSYLHPLFLPEVQTDGDTDMMGAGQKMDSKHLDPLFAEVAKFVVNTQQGSTSMIQRNYSIGYNRAGKIMDQLEKMGVVGPQVGSKPRQVMIQDPITLESLLNTIG